MSKKENTENSGLRISLCGSHLSDEEGAPKYITKKMFFKECPVAGVSFHIEREDELWDELHEGVEIALVRDRNNQYDRNAVAVALADDYDGNPDDFDFRYILGYIPKSENAEIATMLDLGYAEKFSAKITTYKRYGAYNGRIRITIYLESLVEEIDHSNQYRAWVLTDGEYESLTSNLDEYGFAKFRFGAFGITDRGYFPKVGEKMVLVYHKDDDYICYLMRVLAEGDGCIAFGVDRDEVFACDCRTQYILTNVAGPIVITGEVAEIMSESDLAKYSDQQYLSESKTNFFKNLFAYARFTCEISNEMPDLP